MQYAIFCCHDEKVTSCGSTEHDDDAVMTKFGPVARLLPTTAAMTLRKDRETAMIRQRLNHLSDAATAR